MSFDVPARLQERGWRLPTPPTPNGSYVPSVWSGRQLFVAGQTPMADGTLLFEGVVGVDLSLAQAQQAAEQCALNALAIAAAATDGAFERLRVLKVTGFVRCLADFADTPRVLDGASEVLIHALGDRGRHVRAAVGVSALPRRAPVEVEILFEVDQ